MATRLTLRRQLRATLCEIVSDAKTIRVIAIDAGLQPSTINFDGPVENVWQSVLDEAGAQGLLLELLNKVRQFFPGNSELEKLYTQVAAS